MKLFKKLINNSDGFGHIELAILIVTVSTIGFTGYYVYNHNIHKKTPINSLATANVANKSDTPTQSNSTSPVATAKTNTPSSSSTSLPTKTTPSTTTNASVNTPVSPTVIPASLNLNNDSNGQSVTLQVGQGLTLNLTNVSYTSAPAKTSYASQSIWSHFNSSNTSVVGLIGSATYAYTPGSVMGSTDGTSVQTYKALAVGNSTISASSAISSVCGSGIGCPQSVGIKSYDVKVEVVSDAN